MTEAPYIVNLKNRGKIIISGTDNRTFLQSLITNDIELLNSQPCVYSCLLTPQGKFLYDFFITQDNDGALHIDCEGGERTKELGKLLNMYKLRANANIEIIEDSPVYAVINSSDHGYQDPRSPDIGYRAYTKPDLPEKDFAHWDALRISLCIPDGSRDMIEGKSTLLECNIDKLNGLSYDKGCYIGQELTARMHYRGLAKKHLQTVTAKDLELETLPSSGEPIIKDDKKIGEMRSSSDDIGLALLRDI